MQSDAFKNTADSAIAPAEYCFPISPSDTNTLERATKAIYIGTGGDVRLICVRGAEAVTFSNVPDGMILDVRVSSVLAIGTSATNIVGLA